MRQRKCPTCGAVLEEYTDDGDLYWYCDACEREWSEDEILGPGPEEHDKRWDISQERSYLEDGGGV